ncbi:MAG: hypothetical protein SGBAC_011602 [Bacillariaceae sp.]
METIPEKTKATSQPSIIVSLPIPMERLGLDIDDEDNTKKQQDDNEDHVLADAERELTERLEAKGVLPASSTESMGHRNVRAHRRVQSTSLFSILDAPSFTPLRARSMSMADAYPSLDKYYPGSHLVDYYGSYGSYIEPSSLYLSLWLLPPMPLRKKLQQEIAKLAMRYNHHGSSAPFMPHITIVGSIRCETHREAVDLGKALRKGMKGMGGVPCRFSSVSSSFSPRNDGNDPNQTDGKTAKHNNDDNDDNNDHIKCQTQCVAMYNKENSALVWSQSCIAIMERSEEYLKCLELARSLLNLPKGEWMFPQPAGEPHCSTFYGKYEIMDAVEIPPDFVAEEASLYMTTPGTLEGVAKWREVARIPLL